MEKREQTMWAGWASDPVHPNGHIYAKMALNLIEKIVPATDTPGAAASGNRKKTWSASNRDEGESSSSRNWQPDSRGGQGGHGRNDYGYGSANSRQRLPVSRDSRNSSYGVSGSGSGTSKVSNRSAAWKARVKGGGYAPGGKRGVGFGGFAGRGGYRYN
jgi:hypothetical protein